MQTFLPYPSFVQSLQCLDYKRLGKQRVEADQIYRTLTYGGRWENHPAVRMWRGYENTLIMYRNRAIKEWIRRGYNNTMPLMGLTFPQHFPHWLGDEAFHLSHKSNLIRKLPEHYGLMWPDVPDDLPYVWPEGKNDD